MLRFFGILLGVILVFVGVAGFLPSFKLNGFVFGYLSDSFFHHLLYLVTGVLAIMAATSYRTVMLFFKIAGVVYIILALLGLILKGDLSFMFLRMSTADSLFNLVIAIICLYLGFLWSRIRIQS